MKSILLTSSFVLICSKLLIAQYHSTQYFDGADTNALFSINIELDTSSSNIWQIGKPQKNIFDSAATFPNALVTDTINYYPINNSSIFKFTLDHNYSWGIFALQWMQKLDMDKNFDGGIIEFSTDGIMWQNAFNNPYVYNFYGFDSTNVDTLVSGEYAFSGTDTLWKNVWLCFDFSFISEDSLFFRFKFSSDSIDNSRDGWMIDNIIAQVTFIHTVDEVKPESYLTVWPTLTTGIINIEAEKLREYHIIEEIELVNIEGKVIKRYGKAPTKFYIDISDNPEGIYFLNIKTNKKSEIFKIVLQKN